MPRLRVVLRRTLLALGGLLALAVLAAAGLWIYLHPPVERTDGLVYGRRGDQALTFDRLRPAQPNGAAVVVVVSGGWRSKRPGEFATWMAAPLLRRGYTVFAVCHVSQPRATVMEIAADLHRAVRFLRHHAAEHGVDPARFGIT
ncbi:MAG: alpha/beta hydrolase, partial [Verrucomicrobia bacterium]|nr:alpha/beta hydrolase [Verrucomicrobiota bacterium]